MFTPYHSIDVAVKSVLDCVDCAQGTQEPVADDMSRWDTTFVSGTTKMQARGRPRFHCSFSMNLRSACRLQLAGLPTLALN